MQWSTQSTKFYKSIGERWFFVVNSYRRKGPCIQARSLVPEYFAKQHGYCVQCMHPMSCCRVFKLFRMFKFDSPGLRPRLSRFVGREGVLHKKNDLIIYNNSNFLTIITLQRGREINFKTNANRRLYTFRFLVDSSVRLHAAFTGVFSVWPRIVCWECLFHLTFPEAVLQV